MGIIREYCSYEEARVSTKYPVVYWSSRCEAPIEMTAKKELDLRKTHSELLRNETSKRWFDSKRCLQIFRLADGWSVQYSFFMKTQKWRVAVWGPSNSAYVDFFSSSRAALKGPVRLYIAKCKDPNVGKVVERMNPMQRNFSISSPVGVLGGLNSSAAILDEKVPLNNTIGVGAGGNMYSWGTED